MPRNVEFELTTALRQNVEHLHQVVTDVKDYAIFLLDPQGYVLTWNIGAELIKGYTAEEIIGQHFSRFYPEEVVARGWPAHELEVAKKVGRFEDEGWRVRKDGTLFWANVIITTLRDPDGTVRGFSKITRDLTERKRQEEALRLSEERFRLLVEGVRDYAIFMLDTEGRVASWNAGAEHIKGYKAEEIIGQHFSRFYPEVDKARGKPAYELEVVQAEGRFEDEDWRVRKDGTRFWANVIITALRDAEGNLRGYSKITRDLTERKRAEEQLREANVDLEQKVNERTRELAELNDTLRDEDRRKDEFLATLAHELRNPLAPISNALQLMKLAGRDESILDEARGVMERQLTQMVRLVDDLLDVSRISRNKLELRKERIELSSIINSAVETSRPLIQANSHQLTVSIPPHPIVLDADLTRLAQVFSNLLNNAAKYTDPGGRILLRAEYQGGAVAVSIKDTGIGISPAMLPKVFELFTQVDQSMHRSHGGLGIGLTLVKSLVGMHGGTVEARSEGRGRGSEFIVRLPIAVDAGATARDDANGSALTVSNRRRVLIVDDNRDSARSLSLLVRTMGSDVRVVHDGQAAVNAAAEFQPEVILMDIGMPGMNGYEACHAIRQLPGGDRPTIVAVTGWGQEDDRRRSAEAGFSLHVVKPVEAAILQELLAEKPKGD